LKLEFVLKSIMVMRVEILGNQLLKISHYPLNPIKNILTKPHINREKPTQHALSLGKSQSIETPKLNWDTMI